MNQEASTVLPPCSSLLALRFGRGEAESNSRTRTRTPDPLEDDRLFLTFGSEERAAARAEEELPDVEHDAPFDETWPPDESQRPLDDEDVHEIEASDRAGIDQGGSASSFALPPYPSTPDPAGHSAGIIPEAPA